MNTQQLECFVHVAERLNFTKAAEDLCISTPAVSSHIRNLEEELNTSLFIRTSKVVKLTETGSLFYSEAKSILEKMDMAEKKVRKLANQNLTILRVGCSSQAELKSMERTLCDLRFEFPNMYPQITIQDYSQLKSLFDNRQLDILIATKDMINGIHDCVFKKVKDIKSYAVLSPESSLSEKQEISFHDLEDVPLITLHPRYIPFQYGNRLQELIALHSQNHFHILCEHDQSALLLAKCNYGVAILPEIYIPLTMEGLITLPFTDEQATIEYGIAYHKNIREKHIRKFIQYFYDDMAEC